MEESASEHACAHMHADMHAYTNLKILCCPGPHPASRTQEQQHPHKSTRHRVVWEWVCCGEIGGRWEGGVGRRKESRKERVYCGEKKGAEGGKKKKKIPDTRYT